MEDELFFNFDWAIPLILEHHPGKILNSDDFKIRVKSEILNEIKNAVKYVKNKFDGCTVMLDSIYEDFEIGFIIDLDTHEQQVYFFTADDLVTRRRIIHANKDKSPINGNFLEVMYISFAHNREFCYFEAFYKDGMYHHDCGPSFYDLDENFNRILGDMTGYYYEGYPCFGEREYIKRLPDVDKVKFKLKYAGTYSR